MLDNGFNHRQYEARRYQQTPFSTASPPYPRSHIFYANFTASFTIQKTASLSSTKWDSTTNVLRLQYTPPCVSIHLASPHTHTHLDTPIGDDDDVQFVSPLRRRRRRMNRLLLLKNSEKIVVKESHAFGTCLESPFSGLREGSMFLFVAVFVERWVQT